MEDSGAGINLGPVFWPIYWGFVISIGLSGITVLQAYTYFPHPKDRFSIQIVAAAMFLLDVTSSALVAQSIYYYLIPHFGSLAPLGSVTPELTAECLVSTIITFISQLYFIYQLYIVRSLGGVTWVYWSVIAVCFLCATLAFAGGIGCVTAMFVFKHGVLSDRNHLFSIFFGLAKGFGALTDIFATIAMTMFLKWSSTGILSTQKMLKSLIQYVVQRGFVVTLVQVLLLVTFYALPNNLTWFAFHVNVTKLYANTFFAMLNGRDHLKSEASKLANSVDMRSTASRHHYATNLKCNPDPFPLEPQHQHPSSMELPTITKSVVIADI